MLRTQIASLKQHFFGLGKSEKLDGAQLLLQLDELEHLAPATRPTETINYERAVRPAPKRTLPAETLPICR